MPPSSLGFHLKERATNPFFPSTRGRLVKEESFGIIPLRPLQTLHEGGALEEWEGQDPDYQYPHGGSHGTTSSVHVAEERERWMGQARERGGEEGWEVCLVHHQKGHWGFPKGKKEPKETPRQSAERELQEETGLVIAQFLPFPPLTEYYSYLLGEEEVLKEVTYFLAEVEGRLTLQPEEISAARWYSFPDAEARLTYLEAKALCRRAQTLLAALK